MAIEGVVKKVVKEDVPGIVHGIVHDVVHEVVNTAIHASEQRMRHFVRDEIRQNNAYLIDAIGTMLEDNVLPQLNAARR